MIVLQYSFLKVNCRSTSSSKHIEIKYLDVRDFMKKRDVTIEHVQTNRKINDLLMKRLQPGIFQMHVTHMRVSKTFDVLDQWELTYILLILDIDFISTRIQLNGSLLLFNDHLLVYLMFFICVYFKIPEIWSWSQA